MGSLVEDYEIIYEKFRAGYKCIVRTRRNIIEKYLDPNLCKTKTLELPKGTEGEVINCILWDTDIDEAMGTHEPSPFQIDIRWPSGKIISYDWDEKTEAVWSDIETKEYIPPKNSK